MKPVYLDHAATTPLHPAVIERMTQVMTTFGNPSSLHQFGRKAQGLLEDAREVVAKSLHAKPSEIIFTSGGSESDTTALTKVAEKYQHLGKHIITTQVEHSAVLKSCAYLETRGFEVTYLPVSETGQISAEQVKAALRPDTILVSIMRTNNEIGAVYPIAEIGELLVEHQALFHTDAVQAYGLESIDVKAWQVDLLSAAAHKINGPKGVGLLYVKEGTQLDALIHGGDQENKKRAGTENTTGIAGFAQAVSLLDQQQKASNLSNYKTYQQLILAGLEKAAIPFHVNGDLQQNSPHILNIAFPGVSSELLLMHLDLKGFAVSAGSACTAGNTEPSHVLLAMYGEDSAYITSSIRLSFGLGLDAAQIERFVEVLIATLNRLSRV